MLLRRWAGRLAAKSLAPFGLGRDPCPDDCLYLIPGLLPGARPAKCATDLALAHLATHHGHPAADDELLIGSSGAQRDPAPLWQRRHRDSSEPQAERLPGLRSPRKRSRSLLCRRLRGSSHATRPICGDRRYSKASCGASFVQPLEA